MRWPLVCIFVTLVSGSLQAADEDRSDSAPPDAPHDRGFYHQRQESLQKEGLDPETDGVSPSVAKKCPDQHAPAPLADTDSEAQTKIDGLHSKNCP